MTNRCSRVRLALTLVFAGPALFLANPHAAGAPQPPALFVITDDKPGAPARHGIDAVVQALTGKGATVRRGSRADVPAGQRAIVIGRSQGQGPAARLLQALKIDPPAAAESLLVQHVEHDGRPVLLVTAPDDRGLMYALLDVADRIGWAQDAAQPLGEVPDIREAPAVVERALSMYTMHRRWFEDRFFDAAYWDRYFDQLARNRFNTFVLIFGYENGGYFAPPYPYFFDVEGFRQVKVVGFTAADQRRYSDALRRLIGKAHARGLNVTLGLWDHVYRGGVQSGGMDIDPDKPVPGLVTGLTQDELMAYSQAALAKFVKTFPEVDAVQFRMHWESGLRPEEMHDFWQGIYTVMKQHAPRMRFDARAKDFPDSLINLAVEMGLTFRIPTKYWAEQMGLPFHPTHVNRQNQLDRRHGYGDLLRYPKTYDMHWRLWNGGTSRVLLWGDPEYVRRFAGSTHLYDGQGYEVNEMLATKMASQPHDMSPFELLGPGYRYYDYEFERYWHFFQVFGRLGYNPDTAPEVWRREFERRFGKAAGPHVERALHRASWVLPMITAYNFPYHRFPMTRGWPEKQRREDLRDYANAEGSDTEQFLSMRDAARLLLNGGESAKVWPQQSSRWFAHVADDVLREVGEAERVVGNRRGPEFESTVVDLRILAGLARYHSRRALSGLAWALWTESGDVNQLDDAIAHETGAIEAWEQLVKAAGEVYAENLRMGLDRAGLTGHWREELEALRKGLKALHDERQQFRPAIDGDGPSIAHVPVRSVRPGEEVVIRATVAGARPVTRVRASYHAGGEVHEVPLEPAGSFTYRGVIPAAHVVASPTYIIQATEDGGRSAIWPVPPTGVTRSLALIVSEDNEAPTVRHAPVTMAAAGQPLRVVAEVADPSGVKWVRLRYRSVTQYEDYKTLQMQPTASAGQFAATVPAAHVDPKFDFMYYIEVMDEAGNGRIHPSLYEEQPYIIVRLQRGEKPPSRTRTSSAERPESR